MALLHVLDVAGDEVVLAGEEPAQVPNDVVQALLKSLLFEGDEGTPIHRIQIAAVVLFVGRPMHFNEHLVKLKKAHDCGIMVGVAKKSFENLAKTIGK